MIDSLQLLIRSFAATPILASRELRKLLERDREGFREAALKLLKEKDFQPGHQYVLTLLVTNRLISEGLANPNGLECSEAIEIARRIQTSIDSFLDVKLLRLIVPANAVAPPVTDPEWILRVLELIGAVSDGWRVTLLTQLLRHEDMRVRSKVALLVGRIHQNLRWVEARLTEPDGRVRANAVESLWGLDTPDSRRVFATALDDPDNRVAGNGALGLYHCGDLSAADALDRMFSHSDPKFRATAAWAMGETSDPRFLARLSSSLSDSDSTVRQTIFRSMAKIRRRMKEIRERGRLQVTITRSETAGGTRRLELAVLGPGNQTLVGMAGSELLIYEKGLVVNRFRLETRREADSATAAFGLPRMLTRDDPFGRALIDGIRTFLRYKRKLDTWAILKYSGPDSNAAAAGFLLDQGPLSLGSGGTRQRSARPGCPDRTAAEIAPIRCTSDTRTLLHAAEFVGLRSSAPESPAEAVRRLIDAVSLARGQRSVFLFLAEPFPGDCRELGDRAKAAKVAVTAIALGHAVSPELSRACSEAGGAAFSAGSPEQLGPVCARAAASLACLHTVEYELPANCNGLVKVQVFAEHGFGEDSVETPLVSANSLEPQIAAESR